MNQLNFYPEFSTIPQDKVAYLVIRKCACSSIKHAMSKYRGERTSADGNSVHSKNEHEIFARDFPADDKWFTFTFVRDPILRFLSFYSNKILNQNLKENSTLSQYERFGFLPHMTLDQTIDHLLAEEFQTEPHILAQTKILDAVGFDLSYIGHLEEFSIGLKEIAQRSGVNLEINHLNRGLNRAMLPSKQQFSRLAEFYQHDIERLGYFASYDAWYEFHLAGKEDRLNLEYGYTFKNEAKLVKHGVTIHGGGATIHLCWRVSPKQYRKRVVRVMRKTGDDLELVVHLPPEKICVPKRTGVGWFKMI